MINCRHFFDVHQSLNLYIGNARITLKLKKIVWVITVVIHYFLHLGACSFRIIVISIGDPRSRGSWCIKETNESSLITDSPVPLMHSDLSDLKFGSSQENSP